MIIMIMRSILIDDNSVLHVSKMPVSARATAQRWHGLKIMMMISVMISIVMIMILTR